MVDKRKRTVARDGDELVCGECAKAFKSYSALKYHRDTQHRRLRFLCGMKGCDAALVTKAALESHSASQHVVKGGSDRVRCTWEGCNASASDADDALQHFKKSHLKGLKPQETATTADKVVGEVGLGVTGAAGSSSRTVLRPSPLSSAAASSLSAFLPGHFLASSSSTVTPSTKPIRSDPAAPTAPIFAPASFIPDHSDPSANLPSFLPPRPPAQRMPLRTPPPPTPIIRRIREELDT